MRRRSGFGTFLSPDEIRRIDPRFVADVFRGVLGLTVMPTKGIGYTVFARGLGGGLCPPDVYLDGILMSNVTADLEEMVSPTDIVAVEAYSRSTQTPAQFLGPRRCGSLVIWTGAR